MNLGAVPPNSTTPEEVTLLILGAGWTYQFLQPQLEKNFITYAATTTTGHDVTIPFKFDPESDDLEPFRTLPHAKYVLITFPLKGRGPSKKLVGMYEQTHPLVSDEEPANGGSSKPRWIQLGSTSVYTASDWVDNSSPIDPSNERGIAEDELISMGGCVLNLAGLYGAARQPGNWISRVAKTKEQLAGKGALHLIHGVDVARAIVEVVRYNATGQSNEVHDTSKGASESISTDPKVFGRRWIICDCVCYDWWLLVLEYDGDSQEDAPPTRREEQKLYRPWVMELMNENGVRALPRSLGLLGRKLDGREFWRTVGTYPERTLKRWKKF